MTPRERIILALDVPSKPRALTLLESLKGQVRNVKVGPGLFLQGGPGFLRRLQEQGYRIFLDLKMHDIPNTVGLGIRSARELGVWMVSVHLLGGKRMLEEAVRQAGKTLLLVGITVLTSLEEPELQSVGITVPIREEIMLLAGLAQKAGLSGVVASPQEVSQLKERYGSSLTLVTPGIRPAGAVIHDQARTLGPLEAVRAGADYLVIGRPVLESPNPPQAFQSILEAMAAAP